MAVDDVLLPVPRPHGPAVSIERSILLLRGQRVLLDRQLAELYGVGTKVLNQAVRRNLERFPEDFLFRPTEAECEALRFVLPEALGRGGRRHPLFAFTEQGVARLSSVLRSPRAVAVNVEIMRAFVRVRRWAGEHEELAVKLADLEREFGARSAEHAAHIERIYALLDELAGPESEGALEERVWIGFRTSSNAAGS
ncbi:MAG: ORF6N domain-containing protein [Planctomycetes bacterium]|nr:ORF6N domain-containing protein [Planctomycetota bacterium]